MTPSSDEELAADDAGHNSRAADTLVVDPYEDEVADVPLLATIPTPGSITGEEANRVNRRSEVDAIQRHYCNRQADRLQAMTKSCYSAPSVRAGTRLWTTLDHVSAQYAAALISGSGAGLARQRVTLDKLLAGKRVSVSPYIGELFEGFRRQRTSPEDMETLFQLITLYATAPRLDPVVLLEVRDESAQRRGDSRGPAGRNVLRHA